MAFIEFALVGLISLAGLSMAEPSAAVSVIVREAARAAFPFHTTLGFIARS